MRVNFFGRLDEQVAKGGLPTALRQLIERFWGEISVKAAKGTIEILKKKPVLVICNHPYELDIFPLIAALPPRKDVFLVASANFLGLGSNIDGHIIPVYIRHTELRSTKWSVWIGSHLSLKARLPRAESRARNSRALKTAVNKVQSGHVVVFSPEGPRGMKGGWGKGLGLVVDELKNSNGYLVMAHVSGVTTLDHFRFIPGLKLAYPRLEVKFFRPVRLARFRPAGAPGELTSKLREEYYRKVIKTQ